MKVYYNEIDPFCCEVLRANIRKGRLPEGDVDERSIRDVQPGELLGYRQIHLFAGIGGIPLGLRWAGLPDDFSVVTGGFPCQDVSCAGKGEGIGSEDDPTGRSGLWWEMRRIIAGVRPAWVLVENVPALRTKGADAVLAALEELGYAAAPLVLGAWAVGAPHRRNRVWIVAHAIINRMEAGTERERRQTRPNACRCGQRTGLVNADSFSLQRSGEPREVAGTAREGQADGEQWQWNGYAVSDSSEARRMAISNVSRFGGCGTLLRPPDSGGASARETTADRQDHRWPARPGQPQYQWEEPRTIKSPFCVPPDGLPIDLAGRRRQSLKALGNAVVPQVVEAIGRAILEFEGAA